MARMVWSVVSITYGFQPPTNMAALFDSWLRNFPSRLRNQILIGVTAICWVLWLSRNDVVFQRAKPNSSLQVIFRATHWIRSWAILSKEEEKDLLKKGCQRLEVIAMDLYSKAGWSIWRRIKN